ncbi:hypothetical protein O6H91_07G036600 [Diphasiastrum complanatum]|uniref:Uncharacterized protein n=1 Tax=Diphasiastrum complanatum TaxID=34168 RepID=A0ACC2D431_DIPCM|nr:hypothetical protein O6H91_07G036600 [Diphasiastrum complanatum]
MFKRILICTQASFCAFTAPTTSSTCLLRHIPSKHKASTWKDTCWLQEKITDLLSQRMWLYGFRHKRASMILKSLHEMQTQLSDINGFKFRCIHSTSGLQKLHTWTEKNFNIGQWIHALIMHEIFEGL